MGEYEVELDGPLEAEGFLDEDDMVQVPQPEVEEVADWEAPSEPVKQSVSERVAEYVESKRRN